MNEKTRLLELFGKAAKEADEFREAKQETMASDKLTDEWKLKSIAEDRKTFISTIDKIREDMLKVVDSREEDYTAFHVRAAKVRLGLADYQAALNSNLAGLRSGHMGKIEIMAMIQFYVEDKKDNLAASRIYEALLEARSPYLDLMEGRIAVQEQLNAFASIRNIINSKVNVGLADIPGRNAAPGDKEYFYYGSGYYAIVKELNEDLSLNCTGATLGKASNADERNRTHYGESNQIEEHGGGQGSEEQIVKKAKAVMGHAGTPSLTIKQLTGGKIPRDTA